MARPKTGKLSERQRAGEFNRAMLHGTNPPLTRRMLWFSAPCSRYIVVLFPGGMRGAIGQIAQNMV